MNFDEAVAWLYASQLHGIKLGLDNVRRLVDALGVRVSGPDAPRFLHVAGTNGKGSVCAMLDAICRAAGLKTGLFTSPHLVTFRERIRVDGEMIREEEVAIGLSKIRALTAGWDHAATFFEITTAVGLAHFQQYGCKVAVLETGLGGRLDATNIVTPAVSVITPIALDHEQWLGSTAAAIAAEKAGIIKEGVPAISSPQSEEAAAVFRRHGEEVGALTVSFVEEPWDVSPIALPGSHQRWNASLAVHALALSGLLIHHDAVARGLREVQWPGRFQSIGGRFVLDGAHNPAAAALLVETWREAFGLEKATLILGVLSDKDVRGICAPVLSLAARVIVVPVQNARTAEPDVIAAIIRGIAPAVSCRLAPDFRTARTIAESTSERILISGSLFLVGEALAQLSPESAPHEISAQ